MNLPDYAEKYSSLGWALTPVVGKASKDPGWQRTMPLPPQDARDIWAGRGDVNMGLVLGPSGIADFEFDSGDIEEFYRLLGGKIPPTPAYRTGSGKHHVLFKAPDKLKRRQKNGMELRAGPAQSVIPPSVHPETGKPYEWLPGHEPWNVELMDVPERVLSFFETRGKTVEGPSWYEALRAEKKLGEGEGRHASLMSYLGKAVQIYDNEDDLLDAALVYAEQTQDPPYPPEIIRAQTADAWRRWRDEGIAPEDPDPITAIDRLGIQPLREIQMRSIRFVWRPFLQESAFHLLVGQKGAGKGSLLAMWAAQMTTGLLTDPPRAVLWFGTEDSYDIDLKPRFMAQSGDDKMLFVVQKSLTLPDDLPYIEEFCQVAGVGMVVIDPLVAAIGKADTNDESSVVNAIGALNRLADRMNMLILGVRHLGKATDRGALAAVLGGVAWVNTPRVVLGLARDDGGTVTLEILAGNRTASSQSYEYRMETAQVEGLDEEVTRLVSVGQVHRSVSDVINQKTTLKKAKETREFILALLAGSNYHANDLALMVIAKTGTNKTTFDTVMNELKEEMKIGFYKDPDDRWMVKLWE